MNKTNLVTLQMQFLQSMERGGRSLNTLKNYKTDLVTPSFSHHKLTVFEYADGANPLNRVSIGSTTSTFTELQMYYIKVQKAYGESSGRAIGDFPTT